MHARSLALLLIPVGVSLVSGCADEDVVGHYWAITATGVENRCTGEPADRVEDFEYRLVYDGTSIEVAIGPDVFATGVANGCQIAYESIVWTDEREDGSEVAWRIRGTAVAQQGGTACALEEGLDWAGTEIFEVVTSEDESLSPGCEYEMTLAGKYVEEVK